MDSDVASEKSFSLETMPSLSSELGHKLLIEDVTDAEHSALETDDEILFQQIERPLIEELD